MWFEWFLVLVLSLVVGARVWNKGPKKSMRERIKELEGIEKL